MDSRRHAKHYHYIMSHQLSVDPNFKLVNQKRIKLGTERAKVINDEVEQLLIV